MPYRTPVAERRAFERHANLDLISAAQFSIGPFLLEANVVDISKSGVKLLVHELPDACFVDDGHEIECTVSCAGGSSIFKAVVRWRYRLPEGHVFGTSFSSLPPLPADPFRVLVEGLPAGLA